uniref:BRCA2 n=1 Tax=Strongyloides papillosus TaxID=174720 RepID=A0A0N5CFL6_STREA
KLLCDSLTKNSVVPIKNIFITKEKGSKTTENNSNVAVKVSETSKNLTELSQVQSTSIEQDASRTGNVDIIYTKPKHVSIFHAVLSKPTSAV